MVRPGPVERVRARLAARAGPEAAARLPSRYQRLGRVVVVRWPEALRPEFAWLAEALRAELHAATVLRVAGPVEGPRRLPRTERLAGTETETEVQEDGLRYRFDAARILYARGNNTERARTARLVRPGERVVDLFAGIGYFALPAARHGRAAEVVAVEENPVSYGFLLENVRLNHLEDRVRPVLGDNREVALVPGRADRVLLGFLPDARPWIGRSVELLDPRGGWLHVHLLRGTRDRTDEVVRSVTERVEAADARVASAGLRVVKAYGPGREHVVVEVQVGAPRERRGP